MKLSDIHIRDPFILPVGEKYYMYGTRASSYGINPGGFDVYISTDLENWSEPIECFNSINYGLNDGANWAPEVHYYNGQYYLFATFAQKNGLRGTFSCVSDIPEGPFKLNSPVALTPEEWECLDGTLYISKDNTPYLVFCHEHTQIINGTICYIRLNEDLSKAIGKPKLIFKATDPYYVKLSEDKNHHYVTDGPFMFRNSKNELMIIWSTYINDKYAVCVAKSDNGEIDGTFAHLAPINNADGGHGMIFDYKGNKKFVMHSPNVQPLERPLIISIFETENSIQFSI